MKALWARKWFRILTCALLVFGLLAGALFLYIWNKLDMISFADGILGEINISDDVPDDLEIDMEGLEILEEAPTVPEGDIFGSKDVINVLLIGSDERTDEFNSYSRADSMTLVSINKKLGTVRLISMERGTGVPILEGEYAGKYDLLTHIFRWGGAELLEKTIEHCFKIEIDHYVRLNFDSVTNIIDTIGGISMEITKREAGALNDVREFGSPKLPYEDGVVRMDGATALSFARLRAIDSNWRRVERQRKVIMAVVDELKDSSFSELNDLLNVVLPMIHTNMSKKDIAGLMLYAPQFFQSEFDQMTVPRQGKYSGVKLRNGKYGRAIDFEFYGDQMYRFIYEGATSEELLAE